MVGLTPVGTYTGPFLSGSNKFDAGSLTSSETTLQPYCRMIAAFFQKKGLRVLPSSFIKDAPLSQQDTELIRRAS